MDNIKILAAAMALSGCMEDGMGMEITAQEAISCLSDINKAVSVCDELRHYDEITIDGIYNEFAKVDILADDLIFTEGEVQPKTKNMDFTQIKQGRVEAITYYLCDKIGIGLPFENTFSNIIKYDWDPYKKRYAYTNYDVCCAFMDIAGDIFCDCYRFNAYYCELNDIHVEHKLLQKHTNNMIVMWEKYEDECINRIELLAFCK